jgi:hypothetical protein
MVVGVLAISASAATYNDDAQIQYKEAVEVLSLVGVIDGKDGNNFDPTGTLTRQEAAKIVTYIINQKSAEALSKTSSFTDVTAGSWAAGYISYCASQGIIAGTGSNKFEPTGTLTGTAWAKIILCALGYDADAEGFTNANWAVNVTAKSEELELTKGIANFNYDAAITREEACQIAFNALGKDIVKYSNNGQNITVSGSDINVSITAGASEAESTGKKLQSKLPETLAVSTEAKDQKDSFGRPAKTYTYGDDKATIVSEPVATFTSKATANEVKTAIGNKLNDSIGAEVVAATANGKTVEVYSNGVIVPITPEFTTATVTTTAATRTHGAYTTYSVTFTGDEGATTGKIYSSVVDATTEKNTAVVTGEVKNNDKVLAYTDNNGKLYIEAVSTISGAISKKASNGSITIGDTTSTVASGVTGAAAVSDYKVDTKTEVEVYVDSNGYFLGTKAAADSTDAYALVVDAYQYSTLDGNKIVIKDYALIATTDGELTEVVVAADATSAKNTVVTYTVDKDGVYTLTAAAAANVEATATTVGSKVTTLGTKYANSTTKYFFVNYDKDGKATGVTAYTGIANVPTISAVAAGKIITIDAGKTPDRIVDVVFVNTNTTAPATTDEFVYYTGAYTETSDGYEITVVKAGAETTMTVKTWSADNTKGLYKSISTDGKTTDATKTGTSVQNKGGLLFVSGEYSSTIADDVVVYVIDSYDSSVSSMTAAELVNEVSGSVYVNTNDQGTVLAIYVVLAA